MQIGDLSIKLPAIRSARLREQAEVALATMSALKAGEALVAEDNDSFRHFQVEPQGRLYQAIRESHTRDLPNRLAYARQLDNGPEDRDPTSGHVRVEPDEQCRSVYKEEVISLHPDRPGPAEFLDATCALSVDTESVELFYFLQGQDLKSSQALMATVEPEGTSFRRWALDDQGLIEKDDWFIAAGSIPPQRYPGI